MKEKTSRALHNLIERAGKLKRYSLEKHIAEIGSGFRGQVMEDGSWTIEFDIPDEKELDASLYTIRLFTQQKEAFSFGQLNQIIKDNELSPNLKTGLASFQKEYFDYLQTHPSGIGLGFFEQGVHLTNEDIFLVVLSKMSHEYDSEKLQKFQLWSRDGIRANVLLQAFARTIFKVLAIIYRMADLCEEELALSS
jgi:hypothetical protein